MSLWDEETSSKSISQYHMLSEMKFIYIISQVIMVFYLEILKADEKEKLTREREHRVRMLY